MKYKEWLNDWLENYVKPSSKIRTYERYQGLVSHIIPKLGEYDLNDLTPMLLQRFTTELLESGNRKTGKGLSPNTVNATISVLQNSLKTAFTLGLISDYFGDKIKRPKITEKEIECFSVTEQRKIEQAALGSSKPKMIGIVICLYTGLRIGELLALEWTDIDFVKGTLSVTKNCHDGKNKNGEYCRLTETPKTHTSRRIIPIPKQLLPILKKLKKQGLSKYVVADNEKIISVRSYQRSFELLLKKIKIPHRGFHALRHTFATRAIECGMDVKTLSEILGHKNSTITLNRYAHSLMEHKTEMMNRLGKLFSSTPIGLFDEFYI